MKRGAKGRADGQEAGARNLVPDESANDDEADNSSSRVWASWAAKRRLREATKRSPG